MRAADADRRGIERDLHDGPQQQLVALAVNLELARRLADSDPPAAKALLDEMRHDLQQALDETARLAQRIHPPLLEPGGLTAALRAAAAIVGVRARIEAPAGATYRGETAATVYWCWLEVIEQAGAGANATVAVRDEDGRVAFEIVASCAPTGGGSDAGFERLRDRIEAFGGRLTIEVGHGRGIRVSGSLPLSR